MASLCRANMVAAVIPLLQITPVPALPRQNCFRSFPILLVTLPCLLQVEQPVLQCRNGATVRLCLMQKTGFSLPPCVFRIWGDGTDMRMRAFDKYWPQPLKWLLFLFSYSVWICNFVRCILPAGTFVCFVEQHHWNPSRCKKICYWAEETGSSQSKGYR